MTSKKINNPRDKKKILREQDHFTRPPRLEWIVKEGMMQPIRKKKKLNSKIYDKK